MPDLTQPAHYHFAIQQHLESSFKLVGDLYRNDINFDWDFGLTSEGDGKQSPEECVVWADTNIEINSRDRWFKARLENACNAVGYTISDSRIKHGCTVLIISKCSKVEDQFEDAYCHDNAC